VNTALVAEWDRELEIDPAEIRRAAGSPARWRLLGSGWDCDAWLADESVVWRVPRRTIAIEPLRRETLLLPRIAARLPLPVPIPRLVRAPTLPALVRHELVPGAELAEQSDVWRVGEALGRFLQALHAPEVANEVRDLVPHDPLDRADPARRITVAQQRLDEVAHRVDVAPLRKIVEEGHGPRLELDTLTHGDLHPRHVLVDGTGGVSGVIDWGDSCLGSSAVDLALVTALPPDEQNAFSRAYGPVDPRRWRHARLIGVHLGAALLASEPEPSMEKVWLAWLERLVQEP
jgi:aminoglycoside phosphotransferase (APT) family kinase protein